MKFNLTLCKTLLLFLIILPLNSQASEKSFEEVLGVKFDSPTANYIITSEDIRRSGATSIPETLRMVPGLHVARQGSHKWAISSRGFNGQYSNKLLVMVDGRTVYTPIFSGTFWDMQDYILEDIDRIEVIRGPGGTIWGANAVNGIINIITKNALKTQGGYVSSTVGNLDASILEARYGGKVNEDLFYRVYAKSSKINDVKNLDGSDAGDNWTHYRAGFRTDYKYQNDTIAIHGDIREVDADNYFTIFPSDASSSPIYENADRGSYGGNLITKWNRSISKNSSTNLQFYVDYDKVYANNARRSANTYDLDFQHILQTSKNNQLIWGLGYRYITDKIKSGPYLQYSPTKLSHDIMSAFIQDKIGLIADKLYLTIGSKFEHNYYTGFEYQPSIKLALYPTPNQTLWSSISKSVRTPTRGERGYILPVDDTSKANGYISLKGNDAYDSEELIAYEVGYRIKPNRKTLLDITAFYNDYKDLQTFELSAGDGGSSRAFLLNENNGEGKSFGFELNSEYSVTRNWRLEANYSYIKLDIDIDPNSSDSKLHKEENLPNNQYRISSKLNVTPKIEFDSSLYYVDDSGENVDSYYKLDIRVSYKPTPNLELTLAGQNLLDNYHQEFDKALYSEYTEVPTIYYFKTSYKF